MNEFQFTNELPVVCLPEQIPHCIYQGHDFYFAYGFTGDMTSVERARFIREIKFNDTVVQSATFDDFIRNAVQKLDETVGLKTFSTLVHPQSSTPVNDMMIHHITSIAGMRTVELPKLKSSEIIFDFELFEQTELDKKHPNGHLVYIPHAKKQLTRNIHEMMEDVHHSAYFSIARSVKYKYRHYIKPFLIFPDNCQVSEHINSGRILLVDDIATSGATLNAALYVVNRLNLTDPAEICIFTLIGKRFRFG